MPHHLFARHAIPVTVEAGIFGRRHFRILERIKVLEPGAAGTRNVKVEIDKCCWFSNNQLTVE